MDFSRLADYAVYFQQGTIYTIMLAFFTVALGFVLAMLLALMRISKWQPFRFLGYIKGDNKTLGAISRFNPLNFLSQCYIELFRCTPILVQIYIIYYGIFGTMGFKAPSFTLFGFIQGEQLIPGIIALSMNSGAYVAEIIRAGIQSIDGGQTEASRSLGMTGMQTMRYIVMPQAVRNILPAIGNEFVVIIKESSVCSLIGMKDIMFNTKLVQGATFLIMEPLLVAAAIYFVLTFTASKTIQYFERRMSRGFVR